MTEDLVGSFGYLTLGSRLKRIGERMQADVARLSAGLDMPVAAGHYPMLAALHREGALTINGLVQAIGISQPAITRSVGQLLAAGLVTVDRSNPDQRVRTVTLSPAGQSLIDRSSAVLWPAVEAAVRQMCQGLSGPLLDQLAALEVQLAAEPLDRRATIFLADRSDIHESA